MRAAAELSAPGSRFLIAEIEGVAAGYARLTVDGEAPSCVTLARPLEINRFYIDQPWHGRGVAHALMTACLEQAKAHDCDGLWLGVWKHNPRALAFYRKWNFAIVGEQPFQLGRDPQMDLVMQRANRLP